METKSWVYAGLLVAGGVGLVKLLGSGPRVLPGKSRVLLLGDSLAVGLTAPLKALAAESKIELQALAKQGTRIDQWAQSQALFDLIDRFQPTVVLISLGTNDEYMMGDAAKRQAPFLDALTQKIARYVHRGAPGAGPEHLVWIGPPTLPKSASNGIVGMIQSKVPRSHYYATEALSIPRGPDKLHPTAKGYAGWAGALWHWLS